MPAFQPSVKPPLPLFSPVPSSEPPKRPKSHRVLHIQHVFDLLHLSILRQDFPRARRAWSILATVREIEWESIYRFEGALRTGVEDPRDQGQGKDREDWLEGLRRGGGREVIPLLQTYIYHLLSLSPPQPTKALDILEIYITSIPYAASPTLHGLAALCALGKSLETPANATGPVSFNYSAAKSYAKAALDLLPEPEQDESDDNEPPVDAASVNTAKTFYLGLSKLADEVARWGRVRGRGGIGAGGSSSGSEDGDEDEDERRRKKRVESRGRSSSNSSEEGVRRMPPVGNSDEGVAPHEEKTDERHDSDADMDSS